MAATSLEGFLHARAAAPAPARLKSTTPETANGMLVRQELASLLTGCGDASEPSAASVEALVRVVEAYAESLAHLSLDHSATHPTPSRGGGGYTLCGENVLAVLAEGGSTVQADVAARTLYVSRALRAATRPAVGVPVNAAAVVVAPAAVGFGGLGPLGIHGGLEQQQQQALQDAAAAAASAAFFAAEGAAAGGPGAGGVL